jgi:hypothetical protein
MQGLRSIAGLWRRLPAGAAKQEISLHRIIIEKFAAGSGSSFIEPNTYY